MKRIKVYNSPVLQIPRINDRQKRRKLQRCDEQSDEGMVEMESANWSDFRQESTNENEGPHIPDSDLTNFVLRLRNMANVS